MKLFCCGDLHLGSGADYGREPVGPDSRLADQERCWARLCIAAAEQSVDGFLFAGDAFHRPRPTPRELAAFKSGLRILGDAGIDVLMIPGNHDVAEFDAPNALTIFNGPGVTIPAMPEDPVEFGGVLVGCLPWTPTSGLVAAGSGNRADVRFEAAERLTRVAAALRARDASILLGHWSVSGCVTATGQETDLFKEPVLRAGDLDFDAMVFGHIHKPQPFGRENRGFYTGSVATCDFGEAGVPHGGWVFDVGDPAQFIDSGDRRFVTLSYDVRGDKQPMTTILGDRGGDDIADAVVRVQIQAAGDQIIDQHRIRDEVEKRGAFKLYAIQLDIERAERPRVEGVGETMGPVEALDRWIAHRGIEPPVSEQMIVKTKEQIG